MAYNDELGFSQDQVWAPTDASGAGLAFTNTTGNCRLVRSGDLILAYFALTYPVTVNANPSSVTGLPISSYLTPFPTLGGYVTLNNSSLVLAILFTAGTNTFNFRLAATGLIATNNQLSEATICGSLMYESFNV